MNKKLVMYGLKGPDGDLVKLNLAFRSFALFETREDAFRILNPQLRLRAG